MARIINNRAENGNGAKGRERTFFDVKLGNSGHSLGDTLSEQVSRNPHYAKLADSITSDEMANDAYFYAFKDAYEQSGYKPTAEGVESSLKHQFGILKRDYANRYMDKSLFRKEYGTEKSFINKGLKALYNKGK